MKNIAFIYSGDETGLNSLEHNRNGVVEKLKDFGAWEIAENKKLDTKSTFTKDLKKYVNNEVDSLLIYYTGHGIKRNLSEKFNLKLSSIDFVSLEELYEIVYENYENSEVLLPEKIAIVVDACYSGRAIYDTKQFGNSEILPSSIGLSFEKGSPSKMSLFSHYFCDAIESLQLTEENINLINIATHLNKFISVQKATYSLLRDDINQAPMTIAKGNLEEKYLGDIEVIYVYIHTRNNQYEVVINDEYTFTVECKQLRTEKTQKQIIDKIHTLFKPFVSTRIELILPKELYSETLPLWRELIVPNCEIILRSEYKASMAENWLPQLKERWRDSFDRCKNMSFLHDDVTVKVQNEAMIDFHRISAVVEKRVESLKVFDGIDAHYFIALWINTCDEEAKYKDFIDSVSQSKLSNLPRDVRKQIVNHSEYCTSEISFMWDDPHTYQEEMRHG